MLPFGLIAAPSAGTRLKATVTDSSGAVVKGAVVEVYTYGKGANRLFGGSLELAEKLTAADGSFEISLPGAGCLVLVKKSGLAPAWNQFFSPSTSGDEEAKFVLVPAGVIRGTLMGTDGKPVAQAEVYAAACSMPGDRSEGLDFAFLTGRVSRELFNTRTGADGKFEIKGFPSNATAQLGVQTPGFVLSTDRTSQQFQGKLPYAPGQENVQLELERAGVIEGIIRSEVSGQALPPARVSVENSSNPFYSALGDWPETTAGADGKFRLENVPPGNYAVQARFGTNQLPDWIAERVLVSVEPGQTTVLEAPLTAISGGVVEVTIVDGTSRAGMPGAIVSAFRSSQMASSIRVAESGAPADSHGKVWLRLVPDDYQLSVSGKSSHASARATAEAGKTNTVEVELASPRVVKGIVRGPDGKPQAGVQVQTAGQMGSRKVKPSRADGTFELEITGSMGSRFPNTIVARDIKQGLAASVVLDDDAESVELKLAPGITVFGSVESEGKPLENPDIALVFWTENSGVHLRGWSTNGSTPGSFEIPALPLGHKYTVIASAQGYGRKDMSVVQDTAAEAGRVDAGKLELKRATLKLAGQVVDSDEKPVKDVQVNISGDSQPSGNTRTDKEGRFSFAAVCEGQIRVHAYAAGGSGNVQAEGGDTNVVVQLGQSSIRYGSTGSGNKLQGIATDPDGKPVKGARIMVLPSDNMPTINTKEDGSFSVRWQAQPWQLESGDPMVIARDLERNLAVAEAFDAAATNVNVRLKPAWIVSGKVETPDGKPLPKAQVNIMALAGRSYSNLESKQCEADAEGKFMVRAVPSGPKYLVSVRLKGYGQVQRELDSESESGEIVLDTCVLSPADKIVSGVVLTPDDKPATGAFVHASGEGQPNEGIQTDKNGRFKLAVCDGEVRVFASGNNSYGDVSVLAGDTNVVVNMRGYDQPRRTVPARASLKGKPLPELATIGLSKDAAPANQPLLLCVMDAEQRPSRRTAKVLADQCKTLESKGVCTLLVQCAGVSDSAVTEWTNSVPMPFTIGRIAEKSADNKWATEVPSLPWLILRDTKGNVVAEGFAVDELESRLNDLLTPAIDLGVPTAGTKK
jgi:hypothetical protein